MFGLMPKISQIQTFTQKSYFFDHFWTKSLNSDFSWLQSGRPALRDLTKPYRVQVEIEAYVIWGWGWVKVEVEGEEEIEIEFELKFRWGWIKGEYGLI